MRNRMFNTISLALIIVFTVNTCAYGVEPYRPPRHDNLAPPTIFKKASPSESSPEFQQSTISDIKALAIFFTIFQSLIVDRAEKTDLLKVLRHEFQGEDFNKIIDKIDVDEIETDQIHGVVFIPFEGGKEVRVFSSTVPKEMFVLKDGEKVLEEGESAKFIIQVVDKGRKKEGTTTAALRSEEGYIYPRYDWYCSLPITPNKLIYRDDPFVTYAMKCSQENNIRDIEICISDWTDYGLEGAMILAAREVVPEAEGRRFTATSLCGVKWLRVEDLKAGKTVDFEVYFSFGGFWHADPSNEYILNCTAKMDEHTIRIIFHGAYSYLYHPLNPEVKNERHIIRVPEHKVQITVKDDVGLRRSTTGTAALRSEEGYIYPRDQYAGLNVTPNKRIYRDMGGNFVTYVVKCDTKDNVRDIEICISDWTDYGLEGAMVLAAREAVSETGGKQFGATSNCGVISWKADDIRAGKVVNLEVYFSFGGLTHQDPTTNYRFKGTAKMDKQKIDVIFNEAYTYTSDPLNDETEKERHIVRLSEHKVQITVKDDVGLRRSTTGTAIEKPQSTLGPADLESASTAVVGTQEELMKAIHAMDLNLIPAIPQRKVLWHVIPEDLIPYSIRSRFMELVKEWNKIERIREKIKITRGHLTVKNAIDDLLQDSNNIVDAAVVDKKDLEGLREKGVKALLFEGELGEFMQLEGILAALRALHQNNSRALISLYEMLTDTSFTGEEEDITKYIDDPKMLAQLIIFKLKPIERMPVQELERLNKRLLELLRAA